MDETQTDYPARLAQGDEVKRRIKNSIATLIARELRYGNKLKDEKMENNKEARRAREFWCVESSDSTYPTETEAKTVLLDAGSEYEIVHYREVLLMSEQMKKDFETVSNAFDEFYETAGKEALARIKAALQS